MQRNLVPEPPPPSTSLPEQQKHASAPHSSKKGTRRRRGRPPKTLLVLIQALVGMRVVVELRNETEVRGRLASVDKEMNLEMAECTLKSVQMPIVRHSKLFISGRVIRYVHIPDALDIGKAIREQVELQTQEGDGDGDGDGGGDVNNIS